MSDFEKMKDVGFSENKGRSTSASRSFNMSRIRAKNTRAEILFRKALWQRNIRFRIHSDLITGKPDIYIKKYKLAIFVDGGFWHGYNWETNHKKIKNNIEFWIHKIEGNMARDRSVNRILYEQGFTVMRFWDHEILKEINKCVNQVLLFVESAKSGKIPDNS